MAPAAAESGPAAVYAGGGGVGPGEVPVTGGRWTLRPQAPQFGAGPTELGAGVAGERVGGVGGLCDGPAGGRGRGVEGVLGPDIGRARTARGGDRRRNR